MKDYMPEDNDVDLAAFMKRFDPSPDDLLYADGMTPDQKKIILKLTRIDKIMVWSVENQIRMARKVDRHDKILSPVAAVFGFLVAAAAIYAAIKK